MSLAPTDNRPCFSEPVVAAVVRLALLNAELPPERYWQERDPRRCWCCGGGGGGGVAGDYTYRAMLSAAEAELRSCVEVLGFPS